MRVLAIDLGGSSVKVLASGAKETRKARSGKGLTPTRLVELVQDLARGWEFDVISLGFPGPVVDGRLREEPVNLGKGWVGFDLAAAFGHPVKLINDAAMQALGSYEGGRMLFLGLGTALGSTLVSRKALVPLEVGQLPFGNGETLVDRLGKKGLERIGHREWQRTLEEAVDCLRRVFVADYVVLGGGNVRKVRPVPEGCRRGGNENAFAGGFRLWETRAAPTHHPDSDGPEQSPPLEWRTV